MTDKKKTPKPVLSLRDRVGNVMPAVLWSLCHQHLREHGYTVREDMDLLVVRSMREAVDGLEEIYRNRVLDLAAEEASKILRAAGCDSAQRLWVALAHGMLGAAERGVRFPENILLVATAVETELAEFDAEFGGLKAVQTAATRMDNVAWASGWWKAPHEKLIQGP